jgi:hypothetical protein
VIVKSFLRLFLVRWLLVLMVAPGLCSAQALPSRMQTAISSVLQAKFLKRGFASNDPRFGPTLQSAGSGIAGAAAAAAVVTAAGVTAPAWITVGITVGLGALFTYGIDLAIDGIKWLLNGDGSVKGPVASAPPVPLSVGGAFWSTNSFFQGIGSSPEASVRASMSDATYGWSLRCNTVAPYQVNCEVWDGQTHWGDGSPYYQSTPNPGYSPSGSPCGSVSGACRNGVVYTPPTPADATFPNISKAVESLTAEQLGKPVNPQVVAAIADAAWKQAASQPGYSGLPYDASDPVTATDAQVLQQQNPSGWPTVGDAVAPQVSPGTGGASSPWSLPSSSTGTLPGGDTGGGTAPNQPIDWGTLTPPVLEETPSIGSILDPLFNLWPSWASFSFPQHQSVCPTPSFTLPGGVLNGQTVHFTQMCDFLEANNVRVAMQAAFAVAWAILIVFIVMGA